MLTLGEEHKERQAANDHGNVGTASCHPPLWRGFPTTPRLRPKVSSTFRGSGKEGDLRSKEWSWSGDHATTGGSLGTGTVVYAYHDQLGSTRRWRLNKSSLGANEYEPYGEAYAVSTLAPRDYALHEWDPAIAAYRAPYRNYSPAMARWMTRDPLGMVDGPNMYGYVGGNPVGSVDPKGMALLDALLGLGTAAIIGLITTAILLYSTHKECKALAECTEALDNLRKLVNETTNTSGANGNISDDEISSESDRRKQLPNILNSPEYKDVLNKCQGLSLMNL